MEHKTRYVVCFQQKNVVPYTGNILLYYWGSCQLEARTIQQQFSPTWIYLLCLGGEQASCVSYKHHMKSTFSFFGLILCMSRTATTAKCCAGNLPLLYNKALSDKTEPALQYVPWCRNPRQSSSLIIRVQGRTGLTATHYYTLYNPKSRSLFSVRRPRGSGTL